MATTSIVIAAIDNGGVAAQVDVTVTVVSTAAGLFDGTGASLQRVATHQTDAAGTLTIPIERTGDITTDGSTPATSTTTIRVGDEVYAGLTIPSSGSPVTLHSLIAAGVDHTVAVTLHVEDPSEAAVAQLGASATLSIDSTDLSGDVILASRPVAATSDSTGLLTWHLDRTDQLTPVDGSPEPYYTFHVGDSVYTKYLRGAGALASLPNAVPVSTTGSFGATAADIAAAENTPSGLHGSPATVQDVLDDAIYLARHPTTPDATTTTVGGVKIDQAPGAGDPVAVTVPRIGAASGVASLDSGTRVPVAQLPTMVASGASHAAGIAPDPGGGAGTTKFLREDATWQVPPSGGGSGGATAARLAFWRAAGSQAGPSLGATSTVINDGRYNGTPVLCVNRRGELVATWRDATAAVGQGTDGIVSVKISADEGQTWGSKAEIATPAGGHDFQPFGLHCIRQGAHAGRLILAYWDYAGGTTGTIYTMYSDDDGRTWSSPAALGTQPYTKQSVGAGNFIEQSSGTYAGTILLPVYGLNTGTSNYGCGVLRCTDGTGTAWSALNVIATVGSSYDEMNLVELPAGVLRAFIRHESATDGLYTADTPDAGLTWSSLAPIGFSAWGGQPSVAVFPVTQETVIVYRHITDQSCAWRWSADYGATWSSETILNANGWAYGSVAALANGLLGLVYADQYGASGNSQADITFVAFQAGVSTVSGSWSGSAAGKNLAAALAIQGQIIDATTLGSGGGGSGTVTAVSVAVPARQTANVTNPTTTPAIAIADNNQAQNLVFAGPTAGAPAAPTFRLLVPLDLPIASTSQIGGAKADGTTIHAAADGTLSAVSSGATLASLGDANIATPHDGDLLMYKSSDSKWHNISPTAPGTIGWEMLTDSQGNLIYQNDGSGIRVAVAN